MSAKNQEQVQPKKKNYLLPVLIVLIIIVAINFLLEKTNIGLDLTHDKRYTLHTSTEQLLKQTKEPIHITLLLTGDDLQKGLKRLSIKSEETIRQLQSLSSAPLSYDKLDPMTADSSYMEMLYQNKITGFPVTVPIGKGATKQIQVFPWAIVSKGDKKIPVLLQEYSSPKLSNADLNQSEILLEYKFASAIKSLIQDRPDTVLYLTGNGQPEDYRVYDMANSISRAFVFEALPLKELSAIPSKYKVVLVQQPTLPFSEIDKWKLDQYLMQGGNMIMAIDGAKASTDSLFMNGQFVALANDINLSDMLFKYGVRLNMNVLSDAEHFVDFPLQSPTGNTEQFPWVYYPIVKSNAEHPIVNNLNEVLIKYGSSIEIANAGAGLKITPLLQTGQYSRAEATPLLITLAQAVKPIDRLLFTKKNITTGVLVEGKFKSLYGDRAPQEILTQNLPITKESTRTGRIAVYADGDLFLNEVSQKNGPLEIGQYMFSPYKFNNKDLLMNTLTYLSDTNHLLDVRNKTYQASILDHKRVNDERNMWQWINILAPTALVILFGIVYNQLRKRKYSQKAKS